MKANEIVRPVLTSCDPPPLCQHVDGVPGGRRGSHRVEGADGDVSDRETAQTGENVPQIDSESSWKTNLI